MSHLERNRSRSLPFFRCVLPGLLLLAALAGNVPAQGLEYVKATYTKYEYRIPMRDGKHLFTAVYAPKEQSHPWPILLVRTPYSVGPYGADRYRSDLWPSPAFAKSGYVFAYQDVRGRYMSEGEFMNVRPTSRRRAVPRTSTNRRTPGTPSTGWSSTSPTTPAAWGRGASPTPGSTWPWG